jgi:hypothetical protein
MAQTPAEASAGEHDKDSDIDDRVATTVERSHG